jgi:hypothetical protein
MPVAILALLGALVTKVVDFARHVRAKDWNAVVTQLVAWAAGVAGAFLLAASDFANGVTFDQLGGYKLSDLNGASLTFIGMAVLSVASKLVDVQKAVDGSQSAAVPPLLPAKKSQPIANPNFASGGLWDAPSGSGNTTSGGNFTVTYVQPETANERQIQGRLASDPGTIHPPKATDKPATKAAKTTKRAAKKP